ncbi:stage V sporulation protein D [Clostridium sp.]|uniref:stage V sporulation protein D n=1 Tax=Clostridium sp. TaxID=1506 RepID=UPI003463DF33
MAKDNYKDEVVVRKRMTVVLLGLFLLLFVLVFRLVYLMVIQGGYLSYKAKEQWTSEVKLSAKRGRILDRNGNELAVSANVYRVDLDLNALRQYSNSKGISMEDIADKLASALEMEKDKVLGIITKTLPSGEPMGSANLVRRIEKAEADKVTALQIKGVMVSPDTKRYYPNNNFLSHVLGTTNVDGEGLTGVELTYNQYLSGVPGMRITELDRNSGELPNIISEYTDPIQGKDLYLTIDEKIQYFAEKAAEQAMSDNKAKAVTIIVMDPKSGEILGLVNKPDFNPNNPREGAESSDELQKMWRNRAVNDTYEPGSIFKVITAAAAMEEGLVGENDVFNCNGSIKIGNRTIHCWKRTGHGPQSFSDIIKNSCNIGFVELGKRLKAETLNKYIDKFGLGKVSGVDLPGEAKGIVKKTEDISETDLATIAFGQTNTVNPVQFLAAFNTIANNGVWIRPHVMKEIKGSEEDVIKYDDYDSKRVVSEETAKTLRTYLQRVVNEGSGRTTYIEGYNIAGKTGTAQKVNPMNGTYEAGKYVASFVGMAPTDDPKLSIFVAVDEPSAGDYYAGVVAAPVAKQVFNNIFNYLEFKVDASEEDIAKSLLNDVIVPEVRGLDKNKAVKALKDSKLEVEVQGNGSVINDINPKPGYTVKEGTKIILYTDGAANYNKEVMVPNLVGMSKEKATELLNSLGLKGSFEGEGITSQQSIEPKTIVNKGTIINIMLSPDAGD